MRIISFELFRRNCVHLKTDYDNEKGTCNHCDNDNVARFTVPKTAYSYAYTPCMEKFCPVLGMCKKVKSNDMVSGAGE